MGGAGGRVKSAGKIIKNKKLASRYNGYEQIGLANPQVSIFDAVGCTISVLFIPTLPPMQRRCRRAASRGKALDYAAVVLFIFADIAEFIMASKVVPAAALSGAPGVSAWQSTASVTL